MDELVVDGKKYINSRMASQLTGYAKDYIGQLVRQGKVEARRVGRAWFVLEEALARHAGVEHKLAKVQPVVAPIMSEVIAGLREETLQEPEPIMVVQPRVQLAEVHVANLPKTWSDIRYVADEGDIMPISDKQDTEIYSDSARVPLKKVISRPKHFTTVRSTDGVIRVPAKHESVASGVEVKVITRERISDSRAQREGDFGAFILQLFIAALVGALILFFVPNFL